MDHLPSTGSLLRYCLAISWIFQAILFCCIVGQDLNDVQFLNVSCNQANFTAILAFPEEFKGAVFPQGKFFNPGCKFYAPDVGTKKMLLSLPIAECGNLLRDENGKITISNTFVIQNHPLVQTDSDTILKASCPLQPEIMLGKEFIHRSHPTHFWTDELEAYMVFQYGENLLGYDVPNKLLIGDEFAIAIHIKDGGKYKDYQVENCWAYEGETADMSKYLLKIHDMFQCRNDWISDFNITRNLSNMTDAVLHGNIKAFKFPASKNLHIQCAVQACSESCHRYCDPESSGSNHHLKRNKRSSDKSYMERNRLMKATIRALGSKLMEKNQKKLLETDKNFLRRSTDNGKTSVRNNASTEDQSNSIELLYSEIYSFNLTNNVVIFTGQEFNNGHEYCKGSRESRLVECVPKLRFGIVTASLSFVIFCLLLVAIGCMLQIHKQQKKHKMDTFLLYNLY